FAFLVAVLMHTRFPSIFFSILHPSPRALHSFPTRRSSDLAGMRIPARKRNDLTGHVYSPHRHGGVVPHASVLFRHDRHARGATRHRRVVHVGRLDRRYTVLGIVV